MFKSQRTKELKSQRAKDSPLYCIYFYEYQNNKIYPPSKILGNEKMTDSREKLDFQLISWEYQGKCLFLPPCPQTLRLYILSYYECDSCFQKELILKKQQDSSFEPLQIYQESTKQSEDYDYFEERIDSKLKQNQQQNIIKNILKSFLSYLVKLQDSNTKQKYQQMYFKQNNKPFSEIKKAVSKKVNVKTNRWNFQLRSLLQSQSLRLIFYDYLVNYSQQWLQKSKAFNLDEPQRLINVLLNCIENNQPLDIKIYKKRNDQSKPYMNITCQLIINKYNENIIYDYFE